MLAIREMLLTRLVTDLMREYGQVTVCGERGFDPDAKTFKHNVDAPEAAVREAFEYDEVHLFTSGNHDEGYGPWVYVIFGNGNNDLHMVSDYITSLAPVMDPFNQLVEAIEDGRAKLTVECIVAKNEEVG